MAVTFEYPAIDSSSSISASEPGLSYYAYREDGSISVEQGTKVFFIRSKLDTILMNRESAYSFTDKNTLLFDNLIVNSQNLGVFIGDFSLKNPNEQFVIINKFFGFKKTEWADIFSVSRVTIYGWLKDGLKPSGENARKISVLYNLLNTLPNRQEGDRLFVGYLNHHINTCNCSLLELFTTGIFFKREIPQLSEILSSLLKKSRQKFKEFEYMEKTSQATEATLDYNLKNLL